MKGDDCQSEMVLPQRQMQMDNNQKRKKMKVESAMQKLERMLTLAASAKASKE